ncbi:MAG: glycosyltransferase [Candidatus Erginobacter occultus]|nr:glycosyltransferase [Candidatus Erginobacter occultus]
MNQEPDLSISAIIPNHNGAGTLEECLEAVFAGGYPGLEVIVVDDASDDDSLKIAERFPVRTVVHDACRGAAAARNSGAGAARGEIIFFIDSDVVIPENTFGLLEEDFRDPDISGVVGMLKPFTRFDNLCSQYKNFYMHHTYRRLPELISVFYTSAAAIRKDVFSAVGGFDERYRSATIEDTDFGVRLTGEGHRLLLDQRLQVDHIRRYDLPGLLKTGFKRAARIAIIALRERRKRKRESSCLTSSPAFLAGIVLAGLATLGLVGAIGLGSPALLLAAAIGWLAILILNRRFLSGLARRRPAFLFNASLLLPLDLLAHGAGAAWGVWSFLRGKKY